MSKVWRDGWYRCLAAFWSGLLLVVGLASGQPGLSATADPSPSMALGIYTSGFVGDRAVMAQSVLALDRWSGKPLSLVGLFLDLESANPAYDIPTALERLWQEGKVGFVNLNTTQSATAIATGRLDASLRRLARAYADWVAQGENRFAFVAPLPEMNGAWEPYSQSPAIFQQAYTRLQQHFAAAGVTAEAIRWVFAPNGWSDRDREFERYYPGSEQVDVVAFSGYNWGYCDRAAWPQWQSPAEVFGPYLDRLRAMAPEKPIFIAQTASTSMLAQGSSPTAKAQWLMDSYAYLAEAGVKAVLYFNLDKECDWAIFRPEGESVVAYRQAIAPDSIGYLPPAQLR
ncbi:glycosyl hydrolase [Almyronema epifaneia]|uniref:Glycosyl hydrolase n=1 Tax=Almyronema epifaneia S1 TaxID=2991925 RepID=A0ABW6IJC6_9CYAN